MLRLLPLLDKEASLSFQESLITSYNKTVWQFGTARAKLTKTDPHWQVGRLYVIAARSADPYSRWAYGLWLSGHSCATLEVGRWHDQEWSRDMSRLIKWISNFETGTDQTNFRCHRCKDIEAQNSRRTIQSKRGETNIALSLMIEAKKRHDEKGRCNYVSTGEKRKHVRYSKRAPAVQWETQTRKLRPLLF